jgi:hypothetical protein
MTPEERARRFLASLVAVEKLPEEDIIARLAAEFRAASLETGAAVLEAKVHVEAPEVLKTLIDEDRVA